MYLVFMAMLTVSMAQAVPAPSIGDAAFGNPARKKHRSAERQKRLKM